MPERTPPLYAIPFPDAHVGDIYYTCPSIEDAAIGYVVTRKTEDGFIQLVYIDDPGDERGKVTLIWGSDSCFPTASEAIRRQAVEDVEYCAPRLERARAIIAAIDAGKPFEHLLVEIEED